MRKLTPKNLRFISLYRKLFIKSIISQKVNNNIWLYKNWLVVCTLSFHIKSNVIFSKKNVVPPNNPKLSWVNWVSGNKLQKMMFILRKTPQLRMSWFCEKVLMRFGVKSFLSILWFLIINNDLLMLLFITLLFECLVKFSLVMK